jgi:uncharacterized protein (TIGR03435 family)
MLPVAVCSVLSLAVSLAQAPTARSDAPQFEAASIRLSSPDEVAAGWSSFDTTPGLMRLTNVTLKRCIVGAYVVGPERVLGGPAWIDTNHFDITARVSQPIGDKALMLMLQMLLAERFKLVLHRESRLGEAMILEVAKNGPKLQPASDAKSSYNNAHERLDATAITMDEFAEILSRNLKLPVVDRTGFTRAFNFTLRWKVDPTIENRDDAIADLRWQVSTAVAKQLGLTLKLRRMPVEILVVDHAEKPSEN